MPTEKADIYTLAKFGDLEAFKKKLILNKINLKDDNDSGLLHYAISGNQFEIAIFLIDNKIDLNLVNSDGQTALHLICINQNLEIADRLLKNGIDINIKDKYGNIALWTAVFNCKGKNYEMVRLLTKYNPDINSKNKAGRSPLDFANQVGNNQLINILEKKE